MKATTTPSARQPGNPLPAAMLRAKRWLVYRKDKKPYYADGTPRSGKLGGPRDLAHLTTYKAACKAVAASAGRMAGVGFALGDGWHGADFDKAMVEGQPVAWVAALIEQADSYAEVSPSGNGIHIIGYGSEELRSFNAARHGVEFYARDRYFTVTGNAVNGAKIKSLAPIHPILLARAQVSEPTGPSAPPTGGGLMWPGDRLTFQQGCQYLDPDMGYEAWYKVGMALHHASGGSAEGLALWDEWSARGDKHKPGECQVKWASFGGRSEAPVTFGTVIHMIAEGKASKKKTKSADPERAAMKINIASDLMGKTFIPAERIIDGRVVLTPGVIVLAGKPKHGKSWLAMGLAISAATGERYMDSGPTKPMQSVYVSCDDPSEARFSRRLHAFAPTVALTGMILITEIDKSVATPLELLSDLVARHPAIRLVVIDTLAAFRESRRNDSPYQQEHDELKAINDWAHKANICVIVVHHLRKGKVETDDAYESISGTLGLQGAVDGMMVLARKDFKSDFDAALDEKLAGLWYRARDLDEEIELGLRLKDGRWSIMGTPGDVFQASTNREIINVLEAHRGEWMSSKEIHAAGDFDCRADSVKKAAMRMAKKGLIEAHRGAVEGKSGGGGGFRAKQSNQPKKGN